MKELIEVTSTFHLNEKDKDDPDIRALRMDFSCVS